jgi:hypothetical protein
MDVYEVCKGGSTKTVGWAFAFDAGVLYLELNQDGDYAGWSTTYEDTGYLRRHLGDVELVTHDAERLSDVPAAVLQAATKASHTSVPVGLAVANLVGQPVHVGGVYLAAIEPMVPQPYSQGGAGFGLGSVCG